MVLSKQNREILINDLNERMESYSESLVDEFMSLNSRIKPLDENEKTVYELLKNNQEGFRSLLTRLLQVHSRDLFFDFFCILDGVAAPENKDWTGVLMIDMPHDFDGHVEFLHDEL